MTKEMKIKEIKTFINNSGFLDNSEYNNSYLWIGVDVLSEFNERFLSDYSGDFLAIPSEYQGNKLCIAWKDIENFLFFFF